MLVTTAIVGESSRKRAVALVGLGDQQLALAEPRVGAERAHLAADHDRRIEPGLARGLAATSDVVVVLPCVPATAMPYFMRISSASISARGMTGMRSARARTTSGFEMLHRRRDHDDVDVGRCTWSGCVADRRRPRRGARAGASSRFGEVGAADRVAERRAAPRRCRSCRCRRCRRSGRGASSRRASHVPLRPSCTSSRQTSATRAAASGRPSRARVSRHRREAFGRGAKAMIASARRAPRARGRGSCSAAPRATSDSAFAR